MPATTVLPLILAVPVTQLRHSSVSSLLASSQLYVKSTSRAPVNLDYASPCSSAQQSVIQRKVSAFEDNYCERKLVGHTAADISIAECYFSVRNFPVLYGSLITEEESEKYVVVTVCHLLQVKVKLSRVLN
jgi:hypothetical protein